ncbi:MAG TPA: hypothetical protein VNO32_16280, partial [Candidatus Acidoferrum sp.]|nr:hypothetical protein [Candidatus Acidoferrum sp.]
MPHQRIGRFGPHTVAVELPLQTRNILDFLSIDGNELIARLDAAPGAGSAGIDAVSGESAIMFDPPDSVIGNRRFQFGIKIEAGEYNRSHGQQEQKNG